jgi:replication-associated recombination protein RarA
MNKFTIRRTFEDVETLWDITQDMAAILQDLNNQETVRFKGTDKNKDKMYALISGVLYRWSALDGSIEPFPR